MHIWYDKQIMNHPERLQKIMELYYENNDNESHIDSNIAQPGFQIKSPPIRPVDWLMEIRSLF